MHSWVHPIAVAYCPAYLDSVLEPPLRELLEWFGANGCEVQAQPDRNTQLIITTARFGQPVPRDAALLFHGKRIYGLGHRPQILTAVSLRQAEYDRYMAHFTELAEHPDGDGASPHQYTGLGPRAVEVLLDQARRGGPEVALGRLMQGQTKSIRVMALISDEAERPLRAIHYDMAGAHPTTDAANLRHFAEDAGRRILTAVCAHEVDQHEILTDLLPQAVWDSLTTPEAMIRAGRDFTRFGFFTTPIAIEKILGYRGGIGEAIAAQYSEGCYAVYEPEIAALITTATGSSRLVDKRQISRDDQALVVGTKPARDGARVLDVEGRPPVRPSVEAVEMMGICESVPSRTLTGADGRSLQAPMARAILHGHLGVESYDPQAVEAVFLDNLYYDYLVSCGTGALASGTRQAFGRSSTLRGADDPRGVVFLEQPGHGVVIVEKWVEGKAPFQTIRETLESGRLKMNMRVPQGPIRWEMDSAPNGQPLNRKADSPR